MKTSGNTILITGGASGLGRALALAFIARGNQVVIAGEDASELDSLVMAHPEISSILVDWEQPDALSRLCEVSIRDYPALNVLIHAENMALRERIGVDALPGAEAMIKTNLLRPMQLNAMLLAQLQCQQNAVIMTVSSGLAFVPMVSMPTYSASKAALHSYTQSLRYQLRAHGVQVIELVGPNLQRDNDARSHHGHAMPLDAFIAECFAILTQTPECEEICVDRVRHLRFAERDGDYDALFTRFNSARMAQAFGSDGSRMLSTAPISKNE